MNFIVDLAFTLEHSLPEDQTKRFREGMYTLSPPAAGLQEENYFATVYTQRKEKFSSPCVAV
jgi:hypothetical protein